MIQCLRDGLDIAPGRIESLVVDYLQGHIKDYHMTAWLATVCCTGLEEAQTVELTRAYAESGQSLQHVLPGAVILDKHSTGGVGDKVTMFAVPVVAACNVPVAKLSGRGLGFMGGTVDKLESVPGLKLDLDPAEMPGLLEKVGMFLTSTSAKIVPGDQATYALRDVSATVDNTALIAASVMSKKVVSGASHVVLDLKYGRGAALPTQDKAENLGDLMVRIAQGMGLEALALIHRMDVPSGLAVGNSLEVAEATRALKGDSVPHFSATAMSVAVSMLSMARPGASDADCEAEILRTIANGSAYEKFLAWVTAQGGDAQWLEQISTHTARVISYVRSPVAGRIADVEARAVGMASCHVGAGRLSRGDQVDPLAGVLLRRHIGDDVTKGEVLAEVHYNGGRPERASALVQQSFTIVPC